jgi:hypothetical protein
MSSPQAKQYDSISLAQYGLAFRNEVGWLDAMIAFDAIFSEERLRNYTRRVKVRPHQNKGDISAMRANQSSLILVKSATDMGKRPTFRTGESIPESGIYRVLHHAHRLPHEVTLLWGQVFPRCAKCQNAVTFQLIRAATRLRNEQGFRVYLYELDEEGESSIAA